MQSSMGLIAKLNMPNDGPRRFPAAPFGPFGPTVAHNGCDLLAPFTAGQTCGSLRVESALCVSLSL